MCAHIQDELRKEEELGQKTAFEWDDDLPGYVLRMIVVRALSLVL